MAGSYQHVTNADGSFDEDISLINSLWDAQEAIEEMWLMIDHLTGSDRTKIYEAWLEGYFKRRCPIGNLPLATFEKFWKTEE